MLFILHIRALTSTSPSSPSPHVDRVVWELCHSLRPALLCGNKLERAWGIFNDQRHGDVYMTSLGGSIAVHVSLPRDVGGLEFKSWALLVEVIGTSVTLGIGVGVSLILHFLKKWPFLNVILPDPSTLIWYWWSGRTVMIFPVVFHRQLSGLWIATVSPACNGYICYTFLLFWHNGGGGFLHCCAAIPIQGVACRGLAVKEWRRRRRRSCASDRPIP